MTSECALAATHSPLEQSAYDGASSADVGSSYPLGMGSQSS